MRMETQAIHAGQAPDSATGAITPPLHTSTTFERDPDGEFHRGYIYSREDNPNRQTLEHCVSVLEGGVGGAAFATGMAAIMSVLQTLQPGDHVIAPDDLYFGVRNLQQKLFGRWGLQISTVDMTNLDAVRKAITPATRMIWTESPSNPLVKVVDLRALADIAHEAGALCCCDNTWGTPVLQQPIKLGADLVVHSATKYLGGHSDAMGGLVISAREDDTFGRLRDVQREGGAVLSPFDSWLIQRGLHTLVCRVKTQCANAMTLASALAEHPGVQRVHYPGLVSDSGHALARQQMSDFGGMLSVCVDGDAGTAMQVTAKLKLVRRATSLGGTHTLIEHRASIEGAQTMAPPNLLRLSVGLEHPLDVLEDLQQALHR